MVLLPAEVAMAAPYSIDLRVRVAKAWDESGDADEVAATFSVSRAWVHRLIQRRRESGSIVPRKQTKFRSRVLAGQEARLAALIAAPPDATLAELRDAMPTTAALSTLWLEIDRLGLTVKKKPYTPTNSDALTWRPTVAGGSRRCRSVMPRGTCSWTNRASPRIYYAAMPAVDAGRASRITRRAAIGKRTPWSQPCAFRN
jgi:transposase